MVYKKNAQNCSIPGTLFLNIGDPEGKRIATSIAPEYADLDLCGLSTFPIKALVNCDPASTIYSELYYCIDQYFKISFNHSVIQCVVNKYWSLSPTDYYQKTYIKFL